MTNEQNGFTVSNGNNSDGLQLYSIYDSKVGKYLPPFFCVNQDDAIRQIKNIVNYSPSLINKFPQDYSLYCVGEFDTSTGVIHPCECLGKIADLSEYVTDDSIKYNELKKDIQEQKFIVQNNCSELTKLKDDYETKMKELAVLYQKYETAISNYDSKKSVDIPVFLDDSSKNKKSILSKLFSI